eukprot:TRINITY_DN2950_c0_g1_i10.p2 TRINITY_DN2950_c0_g1~~TRINITY_DN2950_c0_g1_i10.p2  ORF type:complete len:286 (-),score=32.01 TRINITY_DN2950_c0_g1_i10:2110-2967(-)
MDKDDYDDYDDMDTYASANAYAAASGNGTAIAIATATAIANATVIVPADPAEDVRSGAVTGSMIILTFVKLIILHMFNCEFLSYVLWFLFSLTMLGELVGFVWMQILIKDFIYATFATNSLVELVGIIEFFKAKFFPSKEDGEREPLSWWGWISVVVASIRGLVLIAYVGLLLASLWVYAWVPAAGIGLVALFLSITRINIFKNYLVYLIATSVISFGFDIAGLAGWQLYRQELVCEQYETWLACKENSPSVDGGYFDWLRQAVVGQDIYEWFTDVAIPQVLAII